MLKFESIIIVIIKIIIILIIMIIIIIIIAFKAQFEIFYNLLTAPRTVNPYAQVARAQSCANHVQHIERLLRASDMLHATWYEGTAQLLRLTEFKLHLF